MPTRVAATDHSGRTRADLSPARDPSNEIAKALEEDIIFGALPPAARLIEDNLMARFGATRHFIRQALLQLERKGIVAREKNKGAAVLSLEPAEVRRIYEVREMLQRQAALMIRLPADATTLRAVEQIQREYRAAVAEADYRAVHALNDQFHVTLFSACNNRYLVDTILYFMQLSLPVRAKTMADPQKLKVSVRHHSMMIELLKGADNWALAQLCVEHLQPAKNHYLEQLAGMPSV
jgi:DNA-binding GntR family transcriptional regulator